MQNARTFRKVLSGEWAAEYHVVQQDGAAVVCELRVFALDHGTPRGGLSGRMARKAAMFQQILSAARTAQPRPVTADMVPDTPVARRLALAASLYVSALTQATPLVIVAREMGVSYATARDMIHRARGLGLLVPRRAVQGRAAGALTEAAQQLLS